MTHDLRSTTYDLRLTTPATSSPVGTDQAAEQVMDSVQSAEASASTVADPGDVVKSIQGTAQEIYGTAPDGKNDTSNN
jgi:hypothetical protein